MLPDHFESELNLLTSLKNLAKRILPPSATTRVQTIRACWRKQRDLIRYRGDNVQCPLCDRSFRTFAPTGVLERRFWRTAEGRNLLGKEFIAVSNKKCPICKSSERQRLQYFFLRDRMKILEKCEFSLLDVAPDDFMRDKLFSKLKGEYISIDITIARRPTVVTDLTRMAFQDHCFDAIICSHVLEHIGNDRKAMQELLRVLKPSGWALLQVPIWAEITVEDPHTPKSQYEALYGHQGHVRRYGMDYSDRLRDVGFDVTLDYFARDMPQEKRERFGVDPAEILFICRPRSKHARQHSAGSTER